jgi:hypothetical protein
MPDRTIDERVTILEHKVANLETLPARVEGVELQIVQLRVDMNAGFSALHEAIRAGATETRSEMRSLNEQTHSQMTALHEDTKADVRLVAEHLARVRARLDDHRR